MSLVNLSKGYLANRDNVCPYELALEEIPPSILFRNVKHNIFTTKEFTRVVFETLSRGIVNLVCTVYKYLVKILR